MPRDLAHQWTDEELERLERRIARVYREARNDLQETIDDYFELFRKRDEEMKKLIGTIQNGKEWTEQDYKQWRLNQIGRGKRFEALRDKIAERMTKANETAIAYVNDDTPGIYSLNRNYAAYTIEKVSGNVGFTLWDEQTVRRLIVDQPDVMPYYPAAKAVKRGIDLKWGKKQITSTVTSGILQGNSIKKIADDLQKRIPEMNRSSAVRSARTAVTAAQNGGRMDTYLSARRKGINLKKEWVATLDQRTRHSHRLVDGEIKEYSDKFSNGLRYPGDPNGRPAEIYNCRCTIIAQVEGVDTSDAQRRARDPETGKFQLIENQTYQEWSGWKESLSKYKATNIFGEEISFSEKMGKDSGWTASTDIIKQLCSEFQTKLKEVKVGAVKLAGSVEISGTVMHLSSKGVDFAIHEFAHTISMENQTKFGLYNEADFWKEIKSIQRKYKKAVSNDPSKWISSYEHSSKGADEFMAEAFTQAVMNEYGMDTPEKYGKDLTFSKQVLSAIKKYFGAK